MHCTQCGKELPDDARFCSFCGSAVPPPKLLCPVCGRELAEQAAFCCYCGAKVGSNPSPAPGAGEPVSGPAPGPVSGPAPGPVSGPAPGQMSDPAPGQTSGPVEELPGAPQNGPSRQVPPQPAAAPAQTAYSTVQLYSVAANWYPADTPKAKDRVEVMGKLYIYSDRVEYKKTMMNSAVNMIVPLVSVVKAKMSGPMIFPMDQIASVQESTYTPRIGLSFPSLVLELKNGEKHGFVIALDKLIGASQADNLDRIQRGRECIYFIEANLR